MTKRICRRGLEEIPDDLMMEIFSRLPAKSVGRFRYLSKLWFSCLSNPDFIHKHAIQVKHQKLFEFIDQSPNSFINCNRVEFDDIDKLGDKDIDNVGEKMALGKTVEQDIFRAVSSCNGLLCLRNSVTKLFLLLNPLTKESRQVSYESLSPNMKVGFGYDSSTKDYKIVTLVCDRHSSTIEVFSLRNNSWRRMPSPHFPILTILYDPESCVEVGGFLHWERGRSTNWSSLDSRCVAAYVPSIVTFDLGREKCGELYVPICKGFFIAGISVLEGCTNNL